MRKALFPEFQIMNSFPFLLAGLAHFLNGLVETTINPKLNIHDS